MNLIQIFNSKMLNTTTDRTAVFSGIRPGVTLKVHQRIKEGGKTRVQVFEGLVIARKHGSGPSATITVRKVSNGIGVERIFPLHLPTVEKFEIVKLPKSAERNYTISELKLLVKLGEKLKLWNRKKAKLPLLKRNKIR